MTKEEALNTWCPMSFASGVREYCIASDCACWVVDSVEGKGYHSTSTGYKKMYPAEGHCGLIRSE